LPTTSWQNVFGEDHDRAKGAAPILKHSKMQINLMKFCLKTQTKSLCSFFPFFKINIHLAKTNIGF
jgi:hypothetical protein